MMPDSLTKGAKNKGEFNIANHYYTKWAEGSSPFILAIKIILGKVHNHTIFIIIYCPTAYCVFNNEIRYEYIETTVHGPGPVYIRCLHDTQNKSPQTQMIRHPKNVRLIYCRSLLLFIVASMVVWSGGEALLRRRQCNKKKSHPKIEKKSVKKRIYYKKKNAMTVKSWGWRRAAWQKHKRNVNYVWASRYPDWMLVVA